MLQEQAELRQLQNEVRFTRKWADVKIYRKPSKALSKDECNQELEYIGQYISLVPPLVASQKSNIFGDEELT